MCPLSVNCYFWTTICLKAFTWTHESAIEWKTEREWNTSFLLRGNSGKLEDKICSHCSLLTDISWYITTSCGTTPQLQSTYPLTLMSAPFGHPKSISKTELLNFPALPPQMLHPACSLPSTVQSTQVVLRPETSKLSLTLLFVSPHMQSISQSHWLGLWYF